QIILIQPHIEDITFPQPVHDESRQSQPEPKKVKARFVDGRDDFSEQDIDVTPPFLDDVVKDKRLHQSEQDRNHDEAADERTDGSGEKLRVVVHFLASTKTCRAWLKTPSRTFRTYAVSTLGPRDFKSPSCAASRTSGSTSACALSVSISTARRDWTIFWSADAWARLMSEDTWLCAVLIAASADSTSEGGSMPVMS